MPQLDLVNIPFIPYYISIVLANSVIYYSWKVPKTGIAVNKLVITVAPQKLI